MTVWQNRICGCFGMVDKIFAGHENEEKRAWKLLKKLRKQGVTWEEVEREFRIWLNNEVNCQNHIDEQMESVELHMEPWLRKTNGM